MRYPPLEGPAPAVLKRSILALLALCLPLWAASCGDGALVVLGDRDAPDYHFETARAIPELGSPAKSDNPSLTADLLEIYFTTERAAVPADIWRAERSHPDQPFGTPQPVPSLNSSRTETSAVVSPDGLTCWFASDRPGGLGDLDIWVATRPERRAAWSTPQNLAALNSPGKDIPRPPGQHGQVMPIASDRDTRGYYQIYLATRVPGTERFEAPVLLPELAMPTASTVDGFLSDDGQRLFFVRGPALGPADLFVASRRTPAEPFTDVTPLAALNTASDERDPFLHAGAGLFFFSSDRGGQYEIYVAKLAQE